MKFYGISFLTKTLIIFCGASFVFSSYAAGQTAAGKDAKTLITIKRDASSGGCVEVKVTDFICPSSYSLSIAENGTVVYEGISSVKIRGKRTFKISREEVQELISDFERIKFFDLRDKYVAEYLPGSVTKSVDHAVKTYLTFQTGGKIKTVYNYYGAPKELNELQEKLDRISRHLQK